MLYARELFAWLEPVLMVLALLATLLRPGWLSVPADLSGRFLRRLSRRPWAGAATVAAVGILGAAIVAWRFGPPAPRVSDEFSYLLQADIFAHGRAAMPSPPSPAHFETFFVLVEPTYASKYPPMQGLALAVGTIVGGSPAVALWLLAGGLGSAIFWGLRAFVGPSWALVGAVLAMCRIGIAGYWSHSFWGGSVAAIGGALVWGTAGRLAGSQGTAAAAGAKPREGPLKLGLILGLGLAILANSRPLEGLVLALPAAVVLAIWAIRAVRRSARSQVLLLAGTTSVVLASAGAAMMLHNRAITGDPMTLPYLAWESRYATVPNLAGRRLRSLDRERPAEIRRFYDALEAQYDPTRRWIGTAAAADRLTRTLDFFLGPSLLLVGVGALVVRRRRSDLLMVAATLVFFLGLQQLVRPWWPHYTAPAMLLLLVPATAGLAQLWHWRPQTARWRGAGRSLVCAAAAINVAMIGPQLVERSRETRSWAHQRVALIDELESRPGKDLIFVRYGAAHHPASEWVWNEAEIASSQVVWARDLGVAANQRLLEAFPERRAWWLEVDLPGARGPSLSPYRFLHSGVP